MAFRCIRVGEKSTALADNAIDRKVILKHALPGFFLLECDEIGEIAREILQKMEVVGDILRVRNGYSASRMGSCA